MNSTLKILGYNSINDYDYKITTNLSVYLEKTIHNDGSVSYREIETTYFLDNSTWNIDFFRNIKQFKDELFTSKFTNKIFTFYFKNPNLNKEFKFMVYNNIFSSKWSLKSAFCMENNILKKLAVFINEKYPNINSIFDLNIEKVNLEWIDYLEHNNITTRYIHNLNTKLSGKPRYAQTGLTKIILNAYIRLFDLTDEREEWVKDKWCAESLSKYGITYSKSKNGKGNFPNFTKIINLKIRCEVKKYIKQRLLSNQKFSWHTALNYMNYVPKFINFICNLEPTWNDFKLLDRHHIEKYIEWLKIYVNNIKHKNANPQAHIFNELSIIQTFLEDIQIKGYGIAPLKNIRILIFPSDKPSSNKQSYDQINYIPDSVLEQLFNNINNLSKDIIPVVWTMFKTGLRISDVLELTQDCLVKLSGKYWIESDIEKTYIKGHKIPIDNELADILAVLIDTSKKISNDDNNPNKYIFVRYTGRRKGKPYLQIWISMKLNLLAIDYNITDELGNVYKFKNHPFRHTYAIKMLNGGADILTVQELLAHASPEMTMRYARLLDNTKRKVFDNAVSQGIFSFDTDGKLQDETNGDVPKDILDMLWTNHKLNAIDTPYGTCMQRSKRKCTFAKQPPCLTCNGGKPCKELGVGIFEGDVKKYEIHINSTKALIEQAKTYNREDMAKENEELLDLYEEIHNTITNENIVYGRLERLMKQGDANE